MVDHIREYWRNCQWEADSPDGCPVINGYTQRKVCDGERPDPNATFARWFFSPCQSPTITPATVAIPYEMQLVLECVKIYHPRDLATLVELWMNLIPKDSRKELSYYGAIERAWDTDPLHYTNVEMRSSLRLV